MRTFSTSKVSSRWGLSHRPRSSLHQSHSPGRFSSSDDDISYVHNSKIKLVQLNIYIQKNKLDHYYSSRVDYRSVESFVKTLSSRGVYIRPSVMVAPPFVPGCITPNCLAHGNEGEATPTTTVVILRPLIYGGDSPSLISLWHLRPSLMVSPLFVPEYITPNCLAHGNEGEATPRQQSGFFVLSYMVETWQA